MYHNKTPEQQQELDYGSIMRNKWSTNLKNEQEARKKNLKKIQTRINKLGSEIEKKKTRIV